MEMKQLLQVQLRYCAHISTKRECTIPSQLHSPTGIDSEREGTEEESRKRGASSSSSSDSELKEQKDQNIKAFRGEGTGFNHSHSVPV